MLVLPDEASESDSTPSSDGAEKETIASLEVIFISSPVIRSDGSSSSLRPYRYVRESEPFTSESRGKSAQERLHILFTERFP